MRVDKDTCDRFGLQDGQVLWPYKFKNLHWVLDGERFGFGDLDHAAIRRIFERLEPGEVFLGWNEHHNTPYQRTPFPIIKIKDGIITQPHRAHIIEGRGYRGTLQGNRRV